MLYILEIVVALLLIGAILLQSQGGGISPVFGGGGEMYRSKQTVEKLLIIATGILSFLMVIVSIALLSLT